MNFDLLRKKCKSKCWELDFLTFCKEQEKEKERKRKRKRERENIRKKEIKIKVNDRMKTIEREKVCEM